jgi:hypothetical protein
MSVNLHLKLEEMAIFGLSIYLFSNTGLTWWWFWLLLLTPDIGMAGYMVNTSLGSFTYNLLHSKALGVILLLAGKHFGAQVVDLAGIIILAHSSMDRVFGYGLKYKDSFKHTHLGMIGSKKDI